MSPQEPIWITGVGCASALGANFADFADNLLAGKSGISPVTRFPVDQHPSQIASCLPPLPPPAGFDPAAFEQLNGWEQLIGSCAVQAMNDGGIWPEHRPWRIGLVLGLGAEWNVRWEQDYNVGGKQLWTPETNDAGLVRRVQELLGLTGPCSTVAAACASGNIALGTARQWLQRGWVDICLAGAAEYSVTPVSLASFGNLGALSRRNDAPQQASRPFDRQRDGFVMGEGGAILLLEKADQARERRAHVHAELAGFGSTSDAFHQVMPGTDIEPASQAVHKALRQAGLAPQSVGYINAHAPGTALGDAFETRCMRHVFGDSLSSIPISSTKSMTGHLLSAAAAIESVACLVALERQVIPPTINLDEVDLECMGPCHVPHHARESQVDVAISNSFGFGGSNTCIVLRRAA